MKGVGSPCLLGQYTFIWLMFKAGPHYRDCFRLSTCFPLTYASAPHQTIAGRSIRPHNTKLEALQIPGRATQTSCPPPQPLIQQCRIEKCPDAKVGSENPYMPVCTKATRSQIKWGNKAGSSETIRHLKSYEMCASSATRMPKRLRP
jgi:hypothetical protein